MKRPANRALTLLELMVILALVVITIGMLLPLKSSVNTRGPQTGADMLVYSAADNWLTATSGLVNPEK